MMGILSCKAARSMAEGCRVRVWGLVVGVKDTHDGVDGAGCNQQQGMAEVFRRQ